MALASHMKKIVIKTGSAAIPIKLKIVTEMLPFIRPSESAKEGITDEIR
jgi:hypothetical protein